MNLVETSGLGKRYGRTWALGECTLAIPAGVVAALVGPNGAGKTTTIKMVCGLLDPDAGSITIGGRPVNGDLTVRQLVGYVPQDVALYPDLTARESLAFLGRLYRLRGRELAARVNEALELTDLQNRGNDRVDSFSGGMKRRLNVAAGLLHRPDLLVLDEPTVGVDPQSRHAILERVAELRHRGMAVIYTTHYMEEAERVCDRVGIIDHGRLIAEGTRRELVDQLGQKDRIELSAEGDLDALAAACRSVAGVEAASVSDGAVQIVVGDGRRLLPEVIEAAEHAGVPVRSVDVVEPDLEAVFLHLTGTALRE